MASYRVQKVSNKQKRRPRCAKMKVANSDGYFRSSKSRLQFGKHIKLYHLCTPAKSVTLLSRGQAVPANYELSFLNQSEPKDPIQVQNEKAYDMAERGKWHSQPQGSPPLSLSFLATRPAREWRPMPDGPQPRADPPQCPSS